MAAIDSNLLAAVSLASRVAKPGASKVKHCTAGATLTNNEVSGTIVTNQGAGGGITINLPVAVPGMEVVFVVLAGGVAITINPDDGDTIYGGAGNTAGVSFVSPTVFGSIAKLVCVEALAWIVTGKFGAWSTGS